MRLNLNRLRKEEILWLNNHRCKHNHTLLEHPQCIPKDSPLSENIGVLDIETTGLKGDYGFMLSYAIKSLNGKILGRVLTQEEIWLGTFDRKLLKECINDIRRFDKIITYYGGDYRFDLPMLRTRAIKYGYGFPLYKEIKAVDLYSIVKKKLNLHSRRLGVVCDFFNIKAKEHKMTPDIWSGAISGNKRALRWVWKHNIEDVKSTEKLYEKIIDFVGLQNTSI